MKKIEQGIKLTLTILSFWAIFCLMCRIIVGTKLFPIFLNEWYLIAALAVSLGASFKFPLWNVGKYLETSEPTAITGFSRDYKSSYYYLTLGYMGLIIWWYGSERIFDGGWFIGVSFLLVYIQGLFVPYLGEKKEFGSYSSP